MGKAENIKRAKKLKEAKRKREKDAIIPVGLDSASKALQERNLNRGIDIRTNDSGIKYSELLKEFVFPILSNEDDISILRTK